MLLYFDRVLRPLRLFLNRVVILNIVGRSKEVWLASRHLVGAILRISRFNWLFVVRVNIHFFVRFSRQSYVDRIVGLPLRVDWYLFRAICIVRQISQHHFIAII